MRVLVGTLIVNHVGSREGLHDDGMYWRSGLLQRRNKTWFACRRCNWFNSTGLTDGLLDVEGTEEGLLEESML